MAYPPYQQPIVDRGGHVSRPWQLFFLQLAGGAGGGSSLPPGTLVGRGGGSGSGPAEALTIGDGLTLTGTVLAVDAAAVARMGYWIPITNGDPVTPEILFDSAGECIVGFVPTA